MGCPPWMTQGADCKHSSTPEPGMGGTGERRTLSHEWRGTNIGRAICHTRFRGTTSRTARPREVQAYRTQNTPPLQALVGVRVVASLLCHSRLDKLCSQAKTQLGEWSQDMGKLARRPGQEHAEENAPSAREKGIG